MIYVNQESQANDQLHPAAGVVMLDGVDVIAHQDAVPTAVLCAGTQDFHPTQHRRGRWTSCQEDKVQVIDHEPHAWFLFRQGDLLLLDVNCNHGPVGYSVMIQLNAEEEFAYAHQGHAYLDGLAQAVQDAGPGSSYQRRDVSATYAQASMAAVEAWRAAQQSG